ncbi:hypothetical protein ASZ90_010333 [hydrocarbon metagenome]|uniref:Uncharacterized protein n=1 Tax=hydrocarbon metagenome TaxID=938273 RepID=A0A0W8FGG8_9ZZZZ
MPAGRISRPPSFTPAGPAPERLSVNVIRAIRLKPAGERYRRDKKGMECLME